MEKIARICWNTLDWIRPSGSKGKSKSSNSYENIIGFGHEEWILDRTRIMPDGYHYGYLEPLNVMSDIHRNKIYDIHLFTISPSKEKVYIGCLHNAECISKELSKSTYEYYKEKGWIQEMKEEVCIVGGKPKDFTPKNMFNVRFKFSNAILNLSNPPIIKSKILGHRYNLMDKKMDFIFEKDEDYNIKTLNMGLETRTTSSGKIIIDPLHKKIQNAICKLLKKDYSKLILETGEVSLTGQRVDLKGILKDSDKIHYFEIKTYSAKRSIREALGQLLEYNHYNFQKPGRAEKLFIISPEKPDDKDIEYLKILREQYNLPLWFRWYSFENNTLSENY